MDITEIIMKVTEAVGGCGLPISRAIGGFGSAGRGGLSSNSKKNAGGSQPEKG